MLSISKDRSKNSQAIVKIIKNKSKSAPAMIPIRQSTSQPPSQPQPQSQRSVTPPSRANGVQKNLTETSFRQYLDGFVGILPKDLPKTVGGRLRYAIDTMNQSGQIISTEYRLGGWVKFVSPDLSTVTMFNPFARKSWTLKIPQPSNKRLRLYYFSRGTSDETAVVRTLISKLENGSIRLTRN
ncbi:hypothetical protein FK949_gp270 [Paramecium bursaria Chlorella virus NYs1]|uniref:Uncharacterized protein n=1 Tax=Paramecium bursaria Chlorella virus NYs1 TaxID=83442 RepID=M1IK13_9PHYC|nr:hypothetical protein FK949_gp270 [Paramecium bursaria Chlorella virus NYs1]AGE54353.1 hypothetical protein PBCVIL52s1_721L [Paramecium bursaria Chlorella virus IL-5-2s1]AGE55038.1 hypothetical protein PBCVMA1D_706L [Paramecium bursaria Chlorella virus MA1D]AGE58855.1 hypothetical protein PBCVNYs1_714L [Paramecium bursaria Chlorella virus NYs1]